MNKLLSLLIVLFACYGCRETTQMELIESSHSGINFNNALTESDTFNVLTFEYMYNGGGVGVADFNNDGLTDIFFSGNMVSSRLYLNRGNLKFEDITIPAAIETRLWCTGVSVVDIDQDGFMDIYISTVNPHIDKSSPNLLFRNKGVNENGIPVFEEIAAKAGLDDRSYSTQAAFFDYDLDGDLDMYLLTNALENYTRNSPIGQRHDGGGKSVDKLFRNDGLSDGVPQFTNVSDAAGIRSEGWGLGIVVNDINLDGYPDIYVANDFLSNDHLYINQRDGTFINQIASALKHQEYNGMGADIGDINNDGLHDILVVDMMPEDNLRQKTMFSTTGYDRFQKNIQMKYQPQYVRNVLQLNNGNGTFSDIGFLSGIYATDWSWSALIADLDNDGHQDIIITNGYRKDITDLDFVAYSKESSHFGTDSTRMRSAVKAVASIEGVKKNDLIFRNRGNLRFEDVSKTWGITQEAYGNGAAYADFDNDGDLDLVINNINDKAYLYRNNATEINPEHTHYIRLQLKGSAKNSNGIGCRVDVINRGVKQSREYQQQRGYQSSVEPFIHVGLDSLTSVDTVIVHWPGGKQQLMTNVNADRVLIVDEKNAVHAAPLTQPANVAPLTKTSVPGLQYHRVEDDFIDFKGTHTLPQKHSQSGPALAVGDVDNNGYEDLVICGPANRPAYIFYQNKDGVFKKDSLFQKQQEDAGILLFDADGDGDLDLYCVSGSSEFGIQKEPYQDRFYRNTGKTFVLDTAALPQESSSGGTVVACDFDRDGDLDLFVGGRIVPKRYPESPESLLLENDGKGNFKNIIEDVAPTLVKAGLITSALWTDFDNDGWIDLAIVGEWMPVTFFRNEKGKTLSNVFEQSPGWWNSIVGGDFDHDGDIDYVCGNLGWNSLFKASAEQPVTVYAKDFDNNGSFDPLISRYIGGEEYLTHPRETLTDQIVSFRRILTRYHTYGDMTRGEMLPDKQLDGALVLKATNFSSSYIENLGAGKFAFHDLPVAAQTSIINGLQAADINHDGHLDILAVGNSYAFDPLSGWMDAGTGVCLLGDGKGGFKSMTNYESGFFVNTDAKALVSLSTDNGRRWISSATNDSISVFDQAIKGKVITVGFDDVRVEFKGENGNVNVSELYYGQGYLSQSSRRFLIPTGAKDVNLINGRGEKRSLTSIDHQ